MLVGWQRQLALRNAARVDSNFSVFYVSVFYDSMSLWFCVSCPDLSPAAAVGKTAGFRPPPVSGFHDTSHLLLEGLWCFKSTNALAEDLARMIYRADPAVFEASRSFRVLEVLGVV